MDTTDARMLAGRPRHHVARLRRSCAGSARRVSPVAVCRRQSLPRGAARGAVFEPPASDAGTKLREGTMSRRLFLERMAALIGLGVTSPVVYAAVLRRVELQRSPVTAWRECLGLTQAELAGRIGVTQAACAQVERVKQPRRTTLEKAPAALGLEVDPPRRWAVDPLRQAQPSPFGRLPLRPQAKAITSATAR